MATYQVDYQWSVHVIAVHIDIRLLFFVQVTCKCYYMFLNHQPLRLVAGLIP